MLLFERYARSYFQPGMLVLEIGPDIPSTLQRLTGDGSILWHGVDINQIRSGVVRSSGDFLVLAAPGIVLRIGSSLLPSALPDSG